MTTPAKNPNANEPGEPLPLPGLDPAPAGISRLELAARRTLAALVEVELVGEQQALIAEGILALARVVAKAEAKGQAAAASMAFAQILAAYQVLVPIVEDGGDLDAYDQLAADLRDAARRGSEVRDSG